MFTCLSCRQTLRLELRQAGKQVNGIKQNNRTFDVNTNRALVSVAKSFPSPSKTVPATRPTLFHSAGRGSRFASNYSSIKANPPNKDGEEDENKSISDASPMLQPLVDEKGNPFALVTIPDDVRTLKWNTLDWSWGVMERLFQDCEQAKVSFEMEDYIEEETGKKKKRVKLDEKGMHAGFATGWWFDEIGLPKTYNSYVMVCFLHMWILQVRLRQWPKGMAAHLSKLLSNHFFWRIEETMDLVHKMTSDQRHKHMDHYFQVWTGTLIAYDEGLVKGDAVLATAIWRLMFQSDNATDPLKLSLVTRYARKELARLAWLDDKVIMSGYVGFGEPPKSGFKWEQ